MRLTDPDAIVYRSRIDPKIKHYIEVFAPGEEFVKTFYYFKLLKPDSRLILVGKFTDTPVYYDYLQAIIHDLGG